MRYSLVGNITNGVGAPTPLTSSQLELLANGNTGPSGVSLSGGSSVNLVLDLGNRFNIDHVLYYFSGDGDVSFYAAESYNDWAHVSSENFSGGLKITPTNISPRWIKIQHTNISSAELYELQVYNNDDNILFGSKGTYTSYGIDTDGYTVQSVYLYNSASEEKDIHVFIDDSGDTDADELLGLSANHTGPFVSKYGAGLFFPDTFSFDGGKHDGTSTTTSGHLTLSGSETGGTYYSPVLYIGGYKNTRFVWDYFTPSGSRVDYFGSVDSGQCFGVRVHNTAPSGSWVNGSLAEDYDSLWSVSAGSLDFDLVPNGTVVELRDNFDYAQFVVTLSGSDNPYVYKAGFEMPVTISGIAHESSAPLYCLVSSGTVSGKSADLICWCR